MRRKRIIILGPVTTDTYFGGVANFDEELNRAFHRIGHDSMILTLQNEKVENVKDVKFCRSIFELLSTVERYSPDVIIASLQYGLYFYLLPKKYKRIYVLHGFFNRAYYGIIKSIIGSLVQKFISFKTDKIIANSQFTKLINRDFCNIKTDRVVPLGVAASYLEKIEKEEELKKEKGSILYAGRLIGAKRPMRILEALHILQERGIGYHCYMAGDGEQKTQLMRYAQENKLKVDFLGAVSHDDLYDYYKHSEVFISLNDSEPMGITFFEAMLLKCKIICPFTGGQIENMVNLPATNRDFVDVDDVEDIANGISYMLKSGSLRAHSSFDFSYERVAREFLDEYV